MSFQVGRNGKVVLIVWLLLGLMCIPLESRADIYKYVDNEGVVHFTNVPTTSDYRKVSLPLREKVMPSPKNLPLSAPRKAPTEYHYDQLIQVACLQHGVDDKLVKALIKAESAFDPRAVSPKGAMGLMQLMPSTSKTLGVSNPFDPWENIEGGVHYLRELMDRFRNNLVFALAAYNAGPNAVEKYGGIPPYEETLVYIQRVLKYYARYLQ